MKNKFSSSAAVTVSAWIISSFLRSLFKGAVFGYGMSVLKDSLGIAISLFLGFLFYHKAIEKKKMRVGVTTLFSLLTGSLCFVVMIFLREYFTLRSILKPVIMFTVSLLVFSKNLSVKKDSGNKTSNGRLKKILEKYYPSFSAIVIICYIIYTALFVCLAGFINDWDLRAERIVTLTLYSALFSIFYMYIYFLPYLTANKKEHLQKRAIYILNIFAGWTIIAWIIALIWANTVSKQAVVAEHIISESGADELKKYKALLDDGIITPEEFESKKKKLLEL